MLAAWSDAPHSTTRETAAIDLKSGAILCAVELPADPMEVIAVPIRAELKALLPKYY